MSTDSRSVSIKDNVRVLGITLKYPYFNTSSLGGTIMSEEEYTVEVSGVFHVYAESQLQAKEYLIECGYDEGDDNDEN